MEENHLHILFLPILEVADAAAQQVINLAGRFHPAVTAPNYQYREMPAFSRRVGGNFGLFHLGHKCERSRAASASVLSGKPWSAMPGTTLRLVELPHAITRWSYRIRAG